MTLSPRTTNNLLHVKNHFFFFVTFWDGLNLMIYKAAKIPVLVTAFPRRIFLFAAICVNTLVAGWLDTGGTGISSDTAAWLDTDVSDRIAWLDTGGTEFSFVTAAWLDTDSSDGAGWLNTGETGISSDRAAWLDTDVSDGAGWLDTRGTEFSSDMAAWLDTGDSDWLECESRNMMSCPVDSSNTTA